MSQFQPLRVDIEIGGPVGPPVHPIHLDSLLASAKVEKAGFHAGAVQNPGEIINNLPLDHVIYPEGRVWKASIVEFDWISQPFQEAWHMVSNEIDIARHVTDGLLSDTKPSSRVDTGRGTFKSGKGAHELQWAKSAQAWCIGDAEAILELIGDLTQIGTKRRYGYGVVRAVHVTPDEAAAENWKRRYMPVSAHPTAPLIEGGFQPPYFDASRHTIIRNCAV